jgi:hypothetical protein
VHSRPRLPSRGDPLSIRWAEGVFVVASNAILDRAFGKAGPVKEGKDDDFKARLGNMTREERLALMQTMLERVRQYLPAAPKQRRLSSLSAK